MTKQIICRRQPNLLLKWVRRALRVRAVSLSLVILPQIIGLVALAGILYFQRVQETFIVPASSDGNSVKPSLRCFIRPDQVTKVSMNVPVQIDLLSADDRILASGEGMIHSLSVEAGQNVMDIQGIGLSSIVRQANGSTSPRVRIRTRVRCVLDIVSAKGGLGR